MVAAPRRISRTARRSRQLPHREPIENQDMLEKKRTTEVAIAALCLVAAITPAFLAGTRCAWRVPSKHGRPARLMRLRSTTTTAREPLSSAGPPGPELVEVLPLTDRILMLHFDEGHVVHHRRGMARSDEQVIVSPLDTAAASRPESYRISSADDPAYARPGSPDDRRPQEQGDRLRLVRRPLGERPRGQHPPRPRQGALALPAPSRAAGSRQDLHRRHGQRWPRTAGVDLPLRRGDRAIRGGARESAGLRPHGAREVRLRLSTGWATAVRWTCVPTRAGRST